MKKVRLKNSSELILRDASIDDALKMIEYLEFVSGESDNLTFGKGEVNITAEQEKSIISESINDPLSLFIVGEVDGTIASMLNFHGGKRPRTMHTGEFGITVRKDYWNLGIASEMIKYMIAWAKTSKAIRKINLRVRSDNEKAIKLYKNMGFCEEGIITRDFLINGVFYDSISMGITID